MLDGRLLGSRVRVVEGLVSTRARFRSTHASHLGPLCPTCKEPLSFHVVSTTGKKAGVWRVGAAWNNKNKACFEIRVAF